MIETWEGLIRLLTNYLSLIILTILLNFCYCFFKIIIENFNTIILY